MLSIIKRSVAVGAAVLVFMAAGNARAVEFSGSSPSADNSTTVRLSFPAGSTRDSYRMASLPCFPDAAGATTVFGEQLGGYSSSCMRIRHWNAENRVIRRVSL